MEYSGHRLGDEERLPRCLVSRRKVELDFQSGRFYYSLQLELSLLYRILQECLRNAMKHRGLKRFRVRLGENGRAPTSRQRSRVGLIQSRKGESGLVSQSMQERSG